MIVYRSLLISGYVNMNYLYILLFILISDVYSEYEKNRRVVYQ